MKHLFWLAFLLPFLSSCNKPPVALLQLQNQVFVPIQNLPDDFTQSTVVIAYDPECPVCLLYKTSLDYLSKTFTDVDWKVIVPMGSDTNLTKEKFYLDTKVSFYYDTNNQFLKNINATTTPQVFLFDQKGNEIYNGKIDNRVKALGVKTDKPDSLYLTDALRAFSQNTLPLIKKTIPIGCYIQ